MEVLALQDQLLLVKDISMPRGKLIEQVRVIKDFSLAVYQLYAKHDGAPPGLDDATADAIEALNQEVYKQANPQDVEGYQLDKLAHHDPGPRETSEQVNAMEEKIKVQKEEIKILKSRVKEGRRIAHTSLHLAYGAQKPAGPRPPANAAHHRRKSKAS